MFRLWLRYNVVAGFLVVGLCQHSQSKHSRSALSHLSVPSVLVCVCGLSPCPAVCLPDYLLYICPAGQSVHRCLNLLYVGLSAYFFIFLYLFSHCDGEIITTLLGGAFSAPQTPGNYAPETPQSAIPFTPGTPLSAGVYSQEPAYSPYVQSPSPSFNPLTPGGPMSPATPSGIYNPQTPGAALEQGRHGFGSHTESHVCNLSY